jgi:hypothetical protein
MKRVVFAVTFCLAGASAFGVTLKDLNIARDPENLDGAIYATAVFNLNLRSGPGAEFEVISVVPSGAEIPVIGWITVGTNGSELWIRTWHGGRKGWLSAFQEGTRLVERAGGPLFPLSVTVEGVKFRYRVSKGSWRKEEMWLGRGEILEFVSTGSFFRGIGDFVHFDVKYEGKVGEIEAYNRELPSPDDVKLLEPGEGPGWFVDLPSKFLDLNLTCYYEVPNFDFVRPGEYTKYRSGPGFEYGVMEDVLLTGWILFIDDNWALARAFNGRGWLYLGTAEDPNVQIYKSLDFPVWEDLPATKSVNLEDVFNGVDGLGHKGVTIYYDYWPASNTLHIDFVEPYFSPYIDKVTIREAAFYQPPEAAEPLCVKAAREGVRRGWHETVILTYSFDVPGTLDRDAPFRISTKMLYEGSEEFEVDFHCNPPR